MAPQIWLEEVDEHVWHRLSGRVSQGVWRTACGWEMSALRGRLWPQKAGEFGPSPDERCHDCVAGTDTPPWEDADADNLAAPTTPAPRRARSSGARMPPRARG